MQTRENPGTKAGSKAAPPGRGVRTGANLDHGARTFLEASFGESFEDVGIRERATGLPPNVLAGATGSEIALRGSFSRSRHPLARAVLAHEAAHVLQWRRGQQPGAASWSESRLEAEASKAGVAAARGAKPSIQGVAERTKPRYHPIFVTTQGAEGFLEEAKEFYTQWGYGTPKEVESLEQVVESLAGEQGHLDRVTIVSHAMPQHIITSFLTGGPPKVELEDLKRKTSADLPGYITHVREEADVSVLFSWVRGEPKYAALVDRLKLDVTDYVTNQYLWWLYDADYLERVPPKTVIPDRDAVVKAARDNAAAYGDVLRARIPVQPPAPEATPSPEAPKAPDDVSALEAAVKDQLKANKDTYEGIAADQGKDYASFVLSGRDPAVRRVLGGADPKAVGSTGFEAALGKAALRFDRASEIEIRGCRIGDNAAYLEGMSRFFGRMGAEDEAQAKEEPAEKEPVFIAPAVSAPDMFQFFGRMGMTKYDDNPLAMNRLWSNSTLRAAILYWAPILGFTLTGSSTAADLAVAMRGGFVFPAGLTLHALKSQDPGGVPAWLARFGYRLSGAPSIEQQFFQGWTTAGAVSSPPVDWLQDKRKNQSPSVFIFPPDPQYAGHIKRAQATEPQP